jgi:hypothetical protein
VLYDEKRFFHWDLEFPEVFIDLDQAQWKEDGGFDAVVGNPPYVRVQEIQATDHELVDFFRECFDSASANFDLYLLFAEKASELAKPHGIAGFILPNKFFTAKYGRKLRAHLSKQRLVRRIVNFTFGQVFPEVTTYTTLLFLEPEHQGPFKYIELSDPLLLPDVQPTDISSIPLTTLGSEPWVFLTDDVRAILERAESLSVSLGDVTTRIFQGIRTSDNDVYVLRNVSWVNGKVRGDSGLGDSIQVEAEICRPFLAGEDIARYKPIKSDKAVIIPYRRQGKDWRLIPEEVLRERFPLAYSYLTRHKNRLEQRENGRMEGTGWYGYIYPKNLEIIGCKKILTRDIIESVAFSIDVAGNAAFATGYGITLKEESEAGLYYVLALLNSKLLDFVLKQVNSLLRGGYVRVFTQYLEPLPIRRIHFTTPQVERERLAADLIARYERGEHQALLAEVEALLPKTADGDFLAFQTDATGAEEHGTQECSDVVHDLLAHLAEQMMIMHKQKQERVAAFGSVTHLGQPPVGVQAAIRATAPAKLGQWASD